MITMTLFDYYLKYTSEICQGTRPAPHGITLTQTDEMARAMELQSQITSIPLFVAQCANDDDIELPGELFDNFSLEDALAQYMEPKVIPMQASTPLRCFSTASRWTMDWCSIWPTY